MSQEEKLLRAKKVIENSRYLVCLLGMRVSSQCGCTNWRIKTRMRMILKPDTDVP